MQLSKEDKEVIKVVGRKGSYILVLTLIFWLLPHCNSCNRAKKSVPSETLQVGVDLLPGSFGIDSAGLVTGRQKELIDQLLPEDSITWVPFTDRKEALKALQQGEIALYATSYPYAQSQSLSKAIPTDWIYSETFSLLLSKENEERWETQFHDIDHPVPVYASSGEPAVSVVLKNLRELSYPAIQVEVTELSPTQLCIKLVNGEYDYVMTNKELAHAVATADSTIVAIDGLTFETRQVWLVNEEHQELKDKIDEALRTKQNK
ncbi:MAG: hypothetical protein Q4D93_05040 [Porphyromonas sp.]|nr:hypothetical protein [Porphyromonas sp.]